MKNLMNKTLAVAVAMAITGAAFTGCKSKPKDADLKVAVETALTAKPSATGATVAVDKGIATLSGVVADEATKEELGKTASGIKGITSVVNNLTVAAPVAPVTVSADEALIKATNDAVKDFPGVTAAVADGVITLKGEIKKDNLRKLIMTLSTLKPKRVDNTQLVIK